MDFLSYFLRPDSWSVVMCEDSIVLQSGSIAVILFYICIYSIVVVAYFLGLYSHMSLQLLACCY